MSTYADLVIIYDYRLVPLSVFVAILAAYALDLADHSIERSSQAMLAMRWLGCAMNPPSNENPLLFGFPGRCTGGKEYALAEGLLLHKPCQRTVLIGMIRLMLSTPTIDSKENKET